MGIAKRRLPLNVAPSCCWILHRSCVNKSWRDNARMWAKHPRWIFFQMTLSFRVLIAISCFCQHKLTCQLLRINMQNTCNLISKIQEPENGKRCSKLEEGRGMGVECFLFLSYGTVISPLLAVLAVLPRFDVKLVFVSTPMSPLWSPPTRGLRNREWRTGDVFRRPLLWLCNGKFAAPAFDFSENRHYRKL